ncbi:hypothetical protein ACFFRR_008779 [Megaselia abdita]
MIFLKLLIIHVSFSIAHHLTDLDLTVVESSIKAFQNKIKEEQNEVSHSFVGFEKVASVPIPSPKDICLMSIDEIQYSVTLSISETTDVVFSVFIANVTTDTFELIFEKSVPKAISLSCRSIDVKGYVALAFNLSTEHIVIAQEGSPIYEIFERTVTAVQYFPNSNLQSLQLMTRGNEMFLFHSYENREGLERLNCKYFKWSGFSFQVVGEVPCKNAKRIAPFIIRGNIYIAIANYKNKEGHLATKSEILKFDPEQKKFIRFQKIKTFGAVDVKYFKIVVRNTEKQHFIVIANTVNSRNVRDMSNSESLIYKFEESKFVPYQMLKVFGVIKFLPFNLGHHNFLLLASTIDKGLRAFQLVNWKFQDSSSQLSQDAFSRGVSSMRTFETENETLLIIANENMMRNETNIFRPLYKQETSAMELRNEIITWCDKAVKRISHVNITKFLKDFEEAMNRNKTLTAIPETISKAHISKIKTEKLIYKKRNFTENHLEFLTHAHEAIFSMESRLAKLKQLNDEFVSKKVNRDVESDEFDTIEVKKLIVNKNIFVKNISFEVTNSSLNFERLRVQNLSLSGKLNDNNVFSLFTNTLRSSGIQIFNTNGKSINITNVTADRIATMSGMVSERNISDLVKIDSGDYFIDQFVRFSEPLIVGDLEVHERLNNIRVINGQLDVLLLNSDKVQQITGFKEFEHVELREPVVIRGKSIGGLLDEKKPVKHVTEDIVLQGDYILTGDVVVRNAIVGKNIFGESQNLSLDGVLKNGLKLTDDVEMPMKFSKPLTIENLEVFKLNEFNVSDFVMLNSSKIQVITGHKTFLGDLNVDNGLFEANNINGEDLKSFKSKILCQSGDQEIKGNITFRKIITKRLNSTKIEIGDFPLEKLLTKSTKQNIEIEDLKIDKLKVKNLKVQNFNSDSRIFNKPVEKLFENQFTKLYNVFEMPGNTTTFNGIIYVKHLEIEDNLNNHRIEDLQAQIEMLKNDIVLDYPIEFENELKVNNLIIEDTLNSVPVQELETSWLLKEGDQVFTYPQTFLKVSIDNKIFLNGTLNNIPLRDFVIGTYSLHKEEYLENVVFENTTYMRGGIEVSGLVNGFSFDSDVLLKRSDQPQYLQGPLNVKGNLTVEGKVTDLLEINGVVLEVIDEYLSSSFSEITVENAIFENPPKFVTCNGNDLKKDFMDYVWFSNVDVDMPYHVEFMDTVFESPVDFKGPLNGRNIDYLKKMYFSKTIDQTIGTEIKFTGECTFESKIHGENIYLYGPIINRNGLVLINNFDDFHHMTFKLDTDQTIYGQWEFSKAVVEGCLTNSRINDLVLSKDLVRSDITWNYIDALKVFENATIQSLSPDPRSHLNGIDLFNWVSNAALSNENFTIKGPLKVDSIVGNGDIEVHGTVNGRYITKDHILTNYDDQEIKGSVKLVTRNSHTIMSNTINELNVQNINGVNINEFFENLVEVDDLNSTIVVDGNIEFKNQVLAEKFICKINAESEDDIWENNLDSDETEKVKVFLKNLELLEQQLEFYEN